ncbi:unnamed protein product, partial [marine sediment metagenome]
MELAVNSALSDYRVLDMTDEKGMLCSRLLADMGAEVIRVEKPGAGSANLSLCWENLGKHSITLSIETEVGQGLFKRLIRTADVLVESYQPGYLDELNLDYSELRQINP